jgi:hypothetical protein
MIKMKTPASIAFPKNRCLLLFAFVLVFLSFKAQLSAKDIFERRDMVWYGLDFSNAKFIGVPVCDFGKKINEFDLVHKYIPAWNTLVIMQPNAFRLKSTFWKTDIYNDLKPVESMNEKIKPEEIYTLNSHYISKDLLEAKIQAYPQGDKKEGLGLVVVVESFDKPNHLGNYWVVFFDIQTKKILLSEHCSGKPVGFGMRNYWAGSLKHVLEDIHDYKFKMWRRTYIKDFASK